MQVVGKQRLVHTITQNIGPGNACSYNSPTATLTHMKVGLDIYKFVGKLMDMYMWCKPQKIIQCTYYNKNNGQFILIKETLMLQ